MTFFGGNKVESVFSSLFLSVVLCVFCFYLIIFKFCQEWNYDAVVALGHGEPAAAEQEKQEKADKKEKKAKKDKDKPKKNMGYDLSGRRPGPGYLKSKYALDDEATHGVIRDYFLETG